MLTKHSGDAGQVYDLDIKQYAITRTKEFTKDYNHVHLIHDSHANLNQYLQESSTLDGAIFNLGYLPDRKSTRLNSSHVAISYAVFCLKKKKTQHRHTTH